MTENKRPVQVFLAALIGILLLGIIFVPMLKNNLKPVTTEFAHPHRPQHLPRYRWLMK